MGVWIPNSDWVIMPGPVLGSVPPNSSMSVQLAEFSVGSVAQLKLPDMSCPNPLMLRDETVPGATPLEFRRYLVAGVVPSAPKQVAT
jgi:hypothetical protein